MAIVTAVSFVCLFLFFWLGLSMHIAGVDEDDWKYNTVCSLASVAGLSLLVCTGYYIYKVLS